MSATVTDARTKRTREYIDKHGKPLPSVTTVCKESLGGWGTHGLMKWAWQQGIEGKDYTETRDTAATIGTVAHELIDGFIHDYEPDFSGIDPELVEQAAVPFESFLGWYSENHVTFIETELKMVSDDLRVGGRLDGIAVVNQTIALVDYKSGKAIYPDIFGQLGGYLELYEHTTGKHIDHAVALHIGKDGAFSAMGFHSQDLAIARQLFHNALATYRMKRQIDAIMRRTRKTASSEG